MSNLARWEPFRDLVTLREAMDRLFNDSFVSPRQMGVTPFGGESMALDMYQTDDAVVVKTALPGLKAEDVDVSVMGDVLTIKGETRADEEVKEENYVRREMRYGSFSRSVALPVPIKAEEAEAEFKDGMLILRLPKAEEVKAKSIKVQGRNQ